MTSGQWKIHESEFLNLKVLVPSLAEQQKIASCLSSLDELIAANQQQVEALKSHKRGLMQQLFPAMSNEQLAISNCVPKLRFPGFTGEWEVKKLGEIGTTYAGLSGKSKEDFINGNAKYVSFLNVLNNVIINNSNHPTVKIGDNENQNDVRFGDLLFNTSSETPEEVGFCSMMNAQVSNLYLNSFCFGYRFNIINDYQPLFLAYYFRSLYGRNLMTKLAQGVTRYNLSKSNFLKAEIPFSSLAEQQKIADCLSELDEMISAQQQKVEELKEHKKGLMQKLFPKMSN